MDDERKDRSDSRAEPASREEELARRAAKLVKATKPQFKRLVAFTQRRAQVAGKEAIRYVREHESEIKRTAAKFARSRLRGPLGLIADSLANGSQVETNQLAAKCLACGTPNPLRAKFCNEC